MIRPILRLFLLTAFVQLSVCAPPPVQDKDVNEQRKIFSTFEAKKLETETSKDDVQKRPVRDSQPQMNHDMQSDDPMSHSHHENVEQKPAILPLNQQNDQPPRNYRQTVTEKHPEMKTSKESEESEEDKSSEEKKEEATKNKPANQKRESNPQDNMNEHHEMDQHHGLQQDQLHPYQKDTDDIRIPDAAPNRQRRQLLNSNKPDRQSSTTPNSQNPINHDHYSPQNSHLHFASPMNDDDRKTDTDKVQNDEKHMQGDQPETVLIKQRPHTLEAKLDETRITRETEEKPQEDQPKPATLPAYQRPQTLPAKLDDTRKTRETGKQNPQNDQNKNVPEELAHPQLTYPAPIDTTRKTREAEKSTQASGVGKVTLEKDDTLLAKRFQQTQTSPQEKPQGDQPKIDETRKTRETEQKAQNDQPKPNKAQQRPMPLPALLDETRKTRETEEKPQGDQPKPATLPAYQRPLTLPAKIDVTRKTRETEQDHQSDQPKEHQTQGKKPKTQPAPLDESRMTRDTENKPHGDQPKPATLPAYQRPQTLPVKLDDTRKTRETEKQNPQNDQNKQVPEELAHPQLTYPAPVDNTRKTREAEKPSQASGVGKVTLDQPKPATLPAYQRPQTLPAKLEDTGKTRDAAKQNQQNDQSKNVAEEAVHPPLTYSASVDNTRNTREAEKTQQTPGVGKVTLEKDDTVLRKSLQQTQTGEKVPQQKREAEKHNYYNIKDTQNDEGVDKGYHPKNIQVQEEPIKTHRQKRQYVPPPPVPPVPPLVVVPPNPSTGAGPVIIGKRSTSETEPKEVEHPQAAHDFLTSQKEEDDHNSRIASYVPPPQKSLNVPQGLVYRDASSFKNPTDF